MFYKGLPLPTTVYKSRAVLPTDGGTHSSYQVATKLHETLPVITAAWPSPGAPRATPTQSLPGAMKAVRRRLTWSLACCASTV